MYNVRAEFRTLRLQNLDPGCLSRDSSYDRPSCAAGAGEVAMSGSCYPKLELGFKWEFPNIKEP